MDVLTKNSGQMTEGKPNTVVSAYLCVNWRGCCHFNTEHAFVIIHPLHAWKLNLHHSEIHPFNTSSQHQGSFSGKLISSPSLSSCLHQGWGQSSLVGAFQLRQVSWRSLFLVGRAASEGSTTSRNKGTTSFQGGTTTEELSNVGVWVGV